MAIYRLLQSFANYRVNVFSRAVKNGDYSLWSLKPHLTLSYTLFDRSVGSDIAKGEQVLEKSQKIGPSELGILATVGAVRVTCYKLPVVGVMSTGNEVIK